MNEEHAIMMLPLARFSQPKFASNVIHVESEFVRRYWDWMNWWEVKTSQLQDGATEELSKSEYQATDEIDAEP